MSSCVDKGLGRLNEALLRASLDEDSRGHEGLLAALDDKSIEKEELRHLIDVASGRAKASLLIINGKIVDVYNGAIIEGDIAIAGRFIAGISEPGEYEGLHSYKKHEVLDAGGAYVAPGLIDSHIHIESAYVSPEELGRLVVPHGTTTIIADPHEIVNVCGIRGLNYMMESSKNTALSIKFMLPSCVPATPFENAGAMVDAKAMDEPIMRKDILGLGEFMNFPSVINASEDALDKIMVAKNANKLIDGHSPSVHGLALNAYASASIRDDHECSSIKEMHDRISRGIYVLLREGSACHDLRTLVHGVTPFNASMCLLCSDDRQPKTIIEEGHIDNHLKICVEEGLDALSALRMATLNAARCFNLEDRGAIAPSLRADIAIFADLVHFHACATIIGGKLVALDDRYLLETRRTDITPVRGSMNVEGFSKERLKLSLKSNHVNIIEIVKGGVLTRKRVGEVQVDKTGDFIYESKKDVVKIAVIERHNATGNVAVALLGGYGLRRGAIALSIAHDSHNIIVVGADDSDMELAVDELVRQEGGIVLVKDGRVLDAMPMPIAGIMSDKSGAFVDERLTSIHKKAYEELGIGRDVEPVMTLCFMSLAVIPELKLTDLGLFDVGKFAFITLEATDN